MAKTFREKMKELDPERRKKIEARAAYLTAEEQTLRDLRQARHLTQERMAEFLKIRQDNVCRIEQRTDLLISTLRSYVEAMGGHLRIIAEFPNRPPVTLSGFAAMENDRHNKNEEGRLGVSTARQASRRG
jgi:transcriptional regulator with XRE-family HTH domain